MVDLVLVVYDVPEFKTSVEVAQVVAEPPTLFVKVLPTERNLFAESVKLFAFVSEKLCVEVAFCEIVQPPVGPSKVRS